MIDRACISLNRRCNLRCQYCHFAGKETAAQDAVWAFSPDECVKIVDNIVAYCKANRLNQFKLGIVGSGEPLLSFDALQAIVERAKQQNGLFKLYTITNGVAITDAQLTFLHENRAIIAVNFSLDGHEAIHNAMRQGYQQTMASIRRYENLFTQKPRINATVTRRSIAEKERLVDFFMENRFTRVNFSKVFDVTDEAYAIGDAEYADFLRYCENKGLVMRQKREGIDRTYDCAMFGRLCGVGRTNVFITRAGIYPCGRFFGLAEYRLAGYDAPFADLANILRGFQPVDSGCCYYDALQVGRGWG